MDSKYLRMIRGMKRGRRREWSVYVLRCGDGSLYTGIAKDVLARVRQHQAGEGAAYTRSHRPVQLIYQESRLTRSQALVREVQVKRLPRPAKEKLILPHSVPRSRTSRLSLLQTWDRNSTGPSTLRTISR